MAYFAIGMALYSEGSYEDVLGQLSDGLAWASGGETYSLPSKSAIFQARARLGAEPLEGLFRRVARPLATVGTPGAWLAGRRLVAIDGTCLDMADTRGQREFFGRPGVSKGEQAAFPQVRLVALAECGTHAMFDAVVGRYTTSEVELARRLIGRLRPGMLLLADRGFYGFSLWQQAAATGGGPVVADATEPAASTRSRSFPTAPTWSQLSTRSGNFKRRGEGMSWCGSIDYTIDDGRRQRQQLPADHDDAGPRHASASELAACYAQRWEIESALDELKTHQRGARTVLRSKSPDLVLQEIWGHLCCHYAIRTLMADTAEQAGVDPDRVSFVAALRIARRSIAHQGDFPPSDAEPSDWRRAIGWLVAASTPPVDNARTPT